MLTALTAILLCIAADAGTGIRSIGPPNVIYILADDLGYGDLGCYGQQQLSTPNIDRIATEGMLFTDHYSGNTVCSPSRAVLMTGQHPGHVHCRGNGRENGLALDPDMTTLSRLFKNAGYATGAYGKWGLGLTNEKGAPNPMAHGFDRFSGWKSQGIAHTYYPTGIIRDGVEIPLEKGTFVHDLIMKDAFEFIRTNAKAAKPFFCYIPTAVPHAAMHAPPTLHAKWRKVYQQAQHTYIYHEFVRGGARPYSARSVRSGDWKAVQQADPGGTMQPIELYNLNDDLGETRNLAAQFPEMVAKLEGFMEEAHAPIKR